MTGIWLLLGLFVLAYVGAMLLSGRALRGFGLPSGAEFLLVGFLLGPEALGIVERSVIEELAPILMVALGWLALGFGVEYGAGDEPRPTIGQTLAGALLSVSAVGVVGAAAYFVARRYASGFDLIAISVGMGAIGAESCKQAVAWVVERHGAHGPRAALLAGLSGGHLLGPIVAVGGLLAWGPGALSGSFGLRAGVTLGVAIAFGVLLSVLFSLEHRLAESWALLLGVLLLIIGITAQAGLSTMAVGFATGLVLSVLSRHRREIRAMVTRAMQPMVLPVLLVTGVLCSVEAGYALRWVILAALGARIAFKIIVALALLVGKPALRPAGPSFALALATPGILSVAVALSCRLKFPGPVGDSLLAFALLSALMGELLGPPALRRALSRCGELSVETPRSSPRASLEAAE